MSIIKRLKTRINSYFSDSHNNSLARTLSNDNSTPEHADWLMDGYSWIPDWEKILGEDWKLWQKTISSPRTGSSVLISTSMGGNSVLTPLETLFAVALTLRGADVHFLLCDKALPACQNCYASDAESQTEFVKRGPTLCDWCFDVGQKSIKQLGLPLHLVGDLALEEERNQIIESVQAATLAEIENFNFHGINLGESVKSATMRFFGKCEISDEKYELPVLKRYLAGAMISTLALTRLYEKYKFDHTLSNQGFYIPQANVVSVARKFNSHVVAWDLAYRKQCLHFSHDDAIIKQNGDEPNEIWENIFWNNEVKNEVRSYLSQRWSGQSDWQHNLSKGIDEEPAIIAKEIGLNPDKPTIGLLTNVIWDAQISYPANAFANQIDWLITTVEYFKNRNDLQLLIRVHPAEIKSWIASRQFAIEEIKKAFGEIPPNIFIIPPESKLNTYKAMSNCNAVIVYGTIAGLELSCMGIPVIAAGQAWVRNKGITMDVSSPEEYMNILNTLPLNNRLDESTIDRAFKYAYHFYMRTVLPVTVVESQSFENAPYRIKEQSLSNLGPGKDEGLDIACEGILNRNSPFIYPAEKKWEALVK